MTDKRPLILGLGNTPLGRMVTEELGRAYTGTQGLFARLLSCRVGGNSGAEVLGTAYSATTEKSETMHLHVVGWAPVRASPDDASMGCCQPFQPHQAEYVLQMQRHTSRYTSQNLKMSQCASSSATGMQRGWARSTHEPVPLLEQAQARTCPYKSGAASTFKAPALNLLPVLASVICEGTASKKLELSPGEISRGKRVTLPGVPCMPTCCG